MRVCDGLLDNGCRVVFHVFIPTFLVLTVFGLLFVVFEFALVDVLGELACRLLVFANLTVLGPNVELFAQLAVFD